MREEIENRCISLAKYIVRTEATVRQAAGEFGISKSSVHKDMHERLRDIHPGLYAEVREILDYHHAVRHLRGGAATRERWKMIRENRKSSAQSALIFPGDSGSGPAENRLPPQGAAAE